MFTDEQKIFINKKIEEGLTDYIVIANLLYNRDDLTGRSKEAKEIRNYLISTGFVKKEPKQRFSPTKEILTPAHQEFIDQNIQTGITPKQITELLFNQKFQGLENLNLFITAEYRAVHKYIKEKYPEFLVENESGVNQKYAVPRSLKTVMNKVNRWCGQDMNEDKLSLSHRKCLEKLLVYLASPRFVANYDSYTSSADKELFEAEFVRSTWDKPDLTTDEINLYVNVCMDYINLRQIDIKKNKVNEMFNDTQEQKDLTIRLTEILKTISEEYNQCAQRIDKSIQKLNGERSKRIDQHQQKNASILNLVELFQDEKERKMMIQIAEMQNQIVREEAEKFESMSSWKARILGISKEDAI
jgi:hypothetical protein